MRLWFAAPACRHPQVIPVILTQLAVESVCPQPNCHRRSSRLTVQRVSQTFLPLSFELLLLIPITER